MENTIEKKMSTHDAIKLVIDKIKNGDFSSVAQAIDEMKIYTGKDNFSKNVYSKIRDVFNA